jgi:hypothetical protein
VYYHDQHPDQATVTSKRYGLNIKAKIVANVWASMLKKKITKNRVREQGATKRQYDGLYGSDTSSGTANLFDHEGYKNAMVYKMSKLKEGANPNHVGHTSFKMYYNSVIKLLNYQVHVKKNNSACKYDDIKENASITKFLNLAKTGG